MAPTNEMVHSLLANFPVAELASDEERRVFEGIKNRVVGAPDALAELKYLYKIKGFSDFAVGLMWIAERAAKNPEMAAVSPEDETLLLSSFRRAVGEHVPPPAQSAPPEGTVDVTGAPRGETDKAFAAKLEQFAEAVQSGTEGRGTMLESLFNECEAATTLSNGEDFKELGTLLAEFLKYIAENELLDDVRVINIVSNVSSSVSQWAISPAEARTSVLEEALSILRDFKTHFE